MFLPETARAKYYARNLSTLDPKKLNDSFKDSAQKIKYVQAHKYSYSMMDFHLEGMDLQDPSSEQRRFIIRPPTDCEVIGAYIMARSLNPDESIFARWLDPTDVTLATGPGGGVVVPGQVAVVEGDAIAGVAPPQLEPVQMPFGAESSTFKYIEVTGQDGFAIAEAVTQQNVRLNADANYVIEMGSSHPLTVGDNNPVTLTLWIRTNRGTSEEWTLPELLDGSDVPYVTTGASGEPPGIGDIVDQIRDEAEKAVDATTRDTVRCDVIKCNDLDLVSNPAKFQSVWQERIPRPATILDNGRLPGDSTTFRTNCQWSLFRIDFALVASDVTFCQTPGSTFPAELNVFSQSGIAPPLAGNDFYRILNPLVGDEVAGLQFKEVYVRGMTADGSTAKEFQIDSSTAGVSPLNPAHDLTFTPQINPSTPENVKLAYMYIWYRLTP